MGQEIWKIYRIPILLGGISVFVIVFSLLLLIKSIQTTTPIEFSSSKDILGDSNNTSASANPPAGGEKIIVIDIEGGVRLPGVYKLPFSSRIDDAIAKAGGLSEEVDMEILAQRINRASVLIDGAKIYIPKKNDASHNLWLTESKSLTSYNLLISINTASQNELESLPGIGPVTAKKIMDNRPYQILEELVSKKAIGQALFEKIKEKLTL